MKCLISIILEHMILVGFCIPSERREVKIAAPMTKIVS